jgi:hypothetical protein
MTFLSYRMSLPHSGWAQGLLPWWRGGAVCGRWGTDGVVVVVPAGVRNVWIRGWWSLVQSRSVT